MKGNRARIILTALFLLVIAVSIYFTRSMIKPLMFSVILAYLINPLAKLLVRRGLSKRSAVMITLVTLMGFLALGIFFIIPGILKDMLEFLKNTDEYGEAARKYFEGAGYSKLPVYLKDVINNNLLKLEGSLIVYLNDFFDDLIAFTMELPTYILTPVFVYYFLIDTNYFTGILKSLIPMRVRSKAVELGREIDKVIGSFIKSQMILSLVISVLTFVALFFLKIRYALVIALINGITNIIPYFGPVIGLIPALIAAIPESVNKAIIVAVVFFIIQQVESSIIAPKLMGDTIGIHPVIIMIVLILGGEYFGGWGLLLSIPVAGAIKVTYGYVMKNLF